jgi:hypothetical protein
MPTTIGMVLAAGIRNVNRYIGDGGNGERENQQGED